MSISCNDNRIDEFWFIGTYESAKCKCSSHPIDAHITLFTNWFPDNVTMNSDESFSRQSNKSCVKTCVHTHSCPTRTMKTGPACFNPPNKQIRFRGRTFSLSGRHHRIVEIWDRPFLFFFFQQTQRPHGLFALLTPKLVISFRPFLHCSIFNVAWFIQHFFSTSSLFTFSPRNWQSLTLPPSNCNGSGREFTKLLTQLVWFLLTFQFCMCVPYRTYVTFFFFTWITSTFSTMQRYWWLTVAPFSPFAIECHYYSRFQTRNHSKNHTSANIVHRMWRIGLLRTAGKGYVTSTVVLDRSRGLCMHRQRFPNFSVIHSKN